MNVGEYVRTKNGSIDKIKYIDNENNTFLENYNKENNIFGANSIIKKSSPQIIDLIEVGDYLNGWRVNKIERNSGDTGTIIKIGNTTFNVLDNEEIYTPAQENDSYYQRIEKLKTIVTHEQMEVMQYRVEE
jgi:hypothetical protein